jgi:hypothetical protein
LPCGLGSDLNFPMDQSSSDKIIPSKYRKRVTVTMPVSILGYVFCLFMRLRRINVTVTFTDTGFVPLTVTDSQRLCNLKGLRLFEETYPAKRGDILSEFRSLLGVGPTGRRERNSDKALCLCELCLPRRWEPSYWGER